MESLWKIFVLKTYVLKIIHHVTASFTELWSTALRSALWFSCRRFRALDERIHAACDSEAWTKAIYRGRSDDFFERLATVDYRSLWTLSLPTVDTFDFFFFFLSCTIHNAGAHLNRFAIMRVMLASKMVGATPQLPPCCIAAGCSPATEMCKSTLSIHRVPPSSIPFHILMILFNNSC